MSNHSPQHPAHGTLERELAVEQAHVDRVHAELAKADQRAQLVEAEGFARGRTDRTGDVRDEEITGLFERDALVHAAGRRRMSLGLQREGLVFGRLDVDHGDPRADREVRYVGRLGVRDDDYEPLVIDWRAPAASPFYRATPADPHGVVRRRVLDCRGDRVIGVEDDLLVPDPPDDLVVLGDGALMAALTRTRGGGMHGIVATIQAHQDEAIRAPVRGVTEITGGPGTGKTVVALHRTAYLLYSDRRRFESGGILVVGPSAAYTAYIERVLPSLGEESVTLRFLGDVVEAMTADRFDDPGVARLKGSLRIRRVLARLARATVPGAPTQLRVFVAGQAIRLGPAQLDRARGQVLRRHLRNGSREVMARALGQAAWSHVEHENREEFLDRFADHPDVAAFLDEWWRPVDPREVLLWLADPRVARRAGRDVLDDDEVAMLSASMRAALDLGTWSVADAALVDDLAARLGPVPEEKEERGFYEIELLDDVEAQAAAAGALRSGSVASSGAQGYRERRAGDVSRLTEEERRDLLLRGRMTRPDEYAHILVDEAQDLSPMQWRMIGRRGRWASWTVVGDTAQASWPDADEAAAARAEIFGTGPRRHFRMATNYRNAREIFDYAADVICRAVPDADIPRAVRETGVEPRVTAAAPGELAAEVTASVEALRREVDGSIAVVTPTPWADELAPLAGGRVEVLDPLSTKGLEYDATVVVDPDAIVAESPGGLRTLYVALTRAAHRMHVVHP